MKKLIALLLAICIVPCFCFAEAPYTVDYSVLDPFETEGIVDDERLLTQMSDILSGIADAADDISSGVLTMEEKGELLADFGLYVDCGKVGFDLKDLDGDGTPELIIAAEAEDDFFGKMIFALYALKDGAFEQVFASAERDRYYYAGENLFAHEGSSGAADSFETTEKYENGVMIDLGYATEEARFVQYPTLETLLPIAE